LFQTYLFILRNWKNNRSTNKLSDRGFLLQIKNQTL